MDGALLNLIKKVFTYWKLKYIQIVCPEKIEAWGMCSSGCMPPQGGFSFANQNLLTDEECGKIDDPDPDFPINFEAELCAGALLMPLISGCCL